MTPKKQPQYEYHFEAFDGMFHDMVEHKFAELGFQGWKLITFASGNAIFIREIK